MFNKNSARTNPDLRGRSPLGELAGVASAAAKVLRGEKPEEVKSEETASTEEPKTEQEKNDG